MPCLLLTAAAPALAQDPQFQFHVATGISFPTGTTADYLENGWILSGGVRWNPPNWGPFALQADLFYSNYDATRNFLRLANQASASERINDGWADIWGVNFNGVYKFVLGSYGRGYLTAGIGESYRRIRLGETVLLAGTYCDVWWGFCYQAVTPGTRVSQDRSTSNFTWNLGVGAEFPLGWYHGNTSFFVEVRYQHMATAEATEIVPLQIGLRF